MQKLIWENSKGEKLDLTASPYGITEWEGFSGIDLNVQTQKVPFQDGSVFIDALYEDRTIAVTLAIYDGNNLETRYRLRRALISALNPKAGEGYLIYKNDFIEKRIKAIANNPIFETHNSDMVGTPKASLSWTCCDPYWEDVEETTVKFMGNMRNQIEYDGDVETGVNLEYIGYSASLEVENINENKEIELQGIGTNRKIDISTLAGKKTIFATDLYKSMKYIGFYTEDYCVCNGYLFAPYYDWSGVLQLLYFDENNIKRNSIIPAQVIGKFLYFELVTYCENTGEYYIYDSYTNKIFSSSDLETWTENLYIYKDVGDWVVRVSLSETWEISSDGVTWTPSTMTDFMYVEDLGYYAIDNNNMYFDADDLSAVSVIKHEDSPYRFNYLLQFGEYVVAVTNYGTQGANAIFKNNVEVTDNIFGGYLTRVVPFKNDLVGYVEGGTVARLINKNFQNLNGLQYEGEYAFPCGYVNGKLYLKLRDGLLDELVFGYTENLQDYTILNNQEMESAMKWGDVYFVTSQRFLRANQMLYITNDLIEFSEVRELNGFGAVLAKMRNDYIVDYNNIVDLITGYKIENYTPVPFSTSLTGVMCNYLLNSFRIFGDTFYFCTGNGLYFGTDFENFTQECNGENVLDVVVTENNTIILTDTNYYLNGNVVTAPDTFKKVEWSEYYQKFLFISDTACYSSMDGVNFELVDGITGNLIDIIYDEKQSLWWILAETTCYTYYMDLLSEIECSGMNGELCLTDKGVAIIGQQIQEIIYSRSTNLIGKMTATSDMSLSLKTGTNILTFNGGDKDVLFLKYRKKYIGV